MSEKDQIQEHFVKINTKICANSVKIVHQKSKNYIYAPVCYGHLGIVPAMFDQYSRCEKYLTDYVNMIVCYEINPDENLWFKFR